MISNEKAVKILVILVSVFYFSSHAFDSDAYITFRENNKEISGTLLLQKHQNTNVYYSERSASVFHKQIAYLDSIVDSLNLTSEELTLLKKHDFMVSERFSYRSFGEAFHKIYGMDLPVMVTTDAILHALHKSYDRILIDIEKGILIPAVDSLISKMLDALWEKPEFYGNGGKIDGSIKDIELFLIVAKNLLYDQSFTPKYVEQNTIDEVMKGITSEKMNEIPLFSETVRKIDFSQFTVRGHYVIDEFMSKTGQSATPNLSTYFKAMMWLGRIDFMVTQPPAYPPSTKFKSEELQRMAMDAVLLNQLVDLSDSWYLLKRIDTILTFMVGKSDNMTPQDLQIVREQHKLTKYWHLLEKTNYDMFQNALQSDTSIQQKICSNLFMADPFAAVPDTLPISFRLIGQRFIIDSYIFSNVVYDRILYNGKKVWRPMPDVLDALFVLGNNDALVLLQDELKKYTYAHQLNVLRYLVDSYSDDFWGQSLYNCWLSALRSLNPPKNQANLPFFMNTSAWHQEKLNTQSASWTQLRHDNLLYAKQSVTFMSLCEFPHSYIEPYPEFYKRIGLFANKAADYFGNLENISTLPKIISFYENLEQVMNLLEKLAHKQLTGVLFTESEKDFLKRMLFKQGGSGAPPFSGWYADLFYINAHAGQSDFVVADVHTQPTDEGGNVVGKILHYGVGKVNLGVFVAPCASDNFNTMAFVGPVFSCYEKITNNFERLTDQKWAKIVIDSSEQLNRPDWTYSYMASKSGTALPKGRTLEGVVKSTDVKVKPDMRDGPVGIQALRKIKSQIILEYAVSKPGDLRITLTDPAGRILLQRNISNHPTGIFQLPLNSSKELPSGMYISIIESDNRIYQKTGLFFN